LLSCRYSVIDPSHRASPTVWPQRGTTSAVTNFTNILDVDHRNQPQLPGVIPIFRDSLNYTFKDLSVASLNGQH